ncbi:MAG: 50S ribosomal protein L18 [Candidatus Omnitrophica bacterium]|nr:50S ribosomal protein L18 [Candidatus Omnitrophota bacterium]
METKELGRKKRHGRIRKKMQGTPERPRLCVHRSSKNLYVQVVDDLNERTIYSFSTQDKEFVKSCGKASKTAKAEKMGQYFAEKLKKKGVEKVAFDRGGYQYHGRIRALAESLRQGGLRF